MSDIKYEPHVDEHEDFSQPSAYSAPPYFPGAPSALQSGPQFQPYGVPGAAGAPQPGPQNQIYLEQPCQPTSDVNTHINAPPSYMVWSILSSLFCCFPLGIVAIVKSSKVQQLIVKGDFARANIASREAKDWNTAAVLIGILIIAVVVLFRVIMHTYGIY